jgi:guanylate kinase
MTNSRGKLFVVTGPSGAGKDSVIDTAREEGMSFGGITTTSTRPMRDVESEGNPYYFITAAQFEEKIDAGEMIEWAKVYGNYYGSTRAEVDRVRGEHKVVIIKVDPQGARTFKEMIPDATTIFIAPPSFEILKGRLIARDQDSPDVIESRLITAKSELEHLDQWDHVIVNEEGKLQQAVTELVTILKNEKST